MINLEKVEYLCTMFNYGLDYSNENRIMNLKRSVYLFIYFFFYIYNMLMVFIIKNAALDMTHRVTKWPIALLLWLRWTGYLFSFDKCGLLYRTEVNPTSYILRETIWSRSNREVALFFLFIVHVHTHDWLSLSLSLVLFINCGYHRDIITVVP